MDIKNSMLLANMMSSKGGGVEFKTYCYATGNAYIDTGVKSTINKIIVKGRWLISSYSSSTQIMFFGSIMQQSIAGGTYRTGVLGFGQYTSGRVSTFLNSYNRTSGTTNTQQVYNSETSSSTITTPSFEITQSRVYFGDYNFRILGARETSSNRFSNDNIGIELVEFYLDNELVNQFKPAIVNGESGMYDTVTETFYGNANSVGSLVCE